MKTDNGAGQAMVGGMERPVRVRGFGEYMTVTRAIDNGHGKDAVDFPTS